VIPPRTAVVDGSRPGVGPVTPASWSARHGVEPVPERIVEAVSREILGASWNRYPDRGATQLRQALAARHGVHHDEIFVANSSHEVLQYLYLAFAGPGRSVAVVEPSSVHDQLVQMSGATIRTVAWGGDDEGVPTLDPDGSDGSARVPDIVVVDSPNHVTGAPASQHQVLGLMQATSCGLMVVNEDRGEFLTRSAIELLDDDRSLAVVRSLSRTLPLAGLELGYLVGPKWLVTGLFSVVLPYHLDVIRQQVGLLLLSEDEEVSARVRALVSERERVVGALAEMGVQVLETEADFVVFRSPIEDAEMQRALTERDVHIEPCRGGPRLRGWMTAPVGSVRSNDALLRAVGEVKEEIRAGTE
jgi:histidinol-phosphate aminotransferase